MRALRMLTILTFGALLAPVSSAGFPIRELHQSTPDNPPFSRNVYGCLDCSFEEFVAVTPPAGFTRQSSKQSPVSSAVRGAVPDAPGVPQAITVDGLEFVLFAQLQTATVLSFSPQTVIAEVERDTVFTYDAGSVLHELMDPDGATWLLFSISDENPIPGVGLNPDVSQPGALTGLPLPAGWSYSSRSIDEALTVDSKGLARVFNLAAEISFQRLDPVPEPGTAALLATGVLGLAARRKRRA